MRFADTAFLNFSMFKHMFSHLSCVSVCKEQVESTWNR